MNRKALVYPVTVGMVMAASQSALALPGIQGGPLTQLPDGVGNVLADHDQPTALVVAPANRRSVIGTYSTLASASCDNFAAIYGQTYAFPSDVTAALRNDDFVSNYFQLTLGITVRNRDVSNEILRVRTELSRQKQELNNAGLVDHVVEDNWKRVNAQLDALAQQERELQNLPTAAVLACVTNMATAATCMADLVAEQARKLNQLAATRADLTAQKNQLQPAYEQSLRTQAKLDAISASIEALQDEMAFWNSIMGSQLAVSRAAFDLEERVLGSEEKKVVGRASVGYNLFGDEVRLVQDALRDANIGGYTVAQLPVFNVRMNTSSFLVNPAVPTLTADLEPLPYTYPMQQGVLSGVGAKAATSVAFKAVDPAGGSERELGYATLGANAFATGGFEMFVTQGARCGDVTKVEYVYQEPDSSDVKKYKTTSYVPQANPVVFAKSIGLAYNYYAYPGPMVGECTINVDRMNDYWRDAGRKKSWSWFRSSTKTWDNTRQELREDFGMECKLKEQPVSNNPEEAVRIAQAMEQQMYDEMWKLFLTIYAKSYEIKTDKPELVDPGTSTVGATLAGGLMSICGANIYCQIGNVVLKTLDELGGSRAQGTTSSVSRIYGTIHKRFDKDTFMVREGSQAIDMKVCVNAQGCQ